MARPVTHQQIEQVAADLRRAAAEAGVELPVSYTRRVAVDGLAHDAELGVTRLGAGVIIHATPETTDQSRVVIGYADARGQWHRDGRRHIEGPTAEAPAEAVEVGL